MDEEKKDQTVGQVCLDLLKKPDEGMCIGDITKQEDDRYLNEIHKAIAIGMDSFKGDFFIEVRIKKERLFVNMMPRILVIPRFTCPTPFYGQDVFKFDRAGNTIEYIWSVPSPSICVELKKNKKSLEGSSLQLLGFITAFDSGALLLKCNELNGEKKNSLDLIDPKTKELYI